MKNFFKKVNRGLLLGSIVLVGFIAFVISDTINFKKNKPHIEAAICDFTNALADCAVTSSTKEEFQKKIETLISDHWCSDNQNKNTAEYYYGMNINSYKNEIENSAETIYSDKKDIGKVTKWSANPHDFSITKAGAGIAMVEFSCDITAEFNGNPYLITPAETMPISDYSYMHDYDNSGFSVDKLKKMKVIISYQFKMRQIDGKWKICRSQSWGWNEPTITTFGEDEGGDQ